MITVNTGLELQSAEPVMLMNFYAEANMDYDDSHTTKKHNFKIEDGSRTPYLKIVLAIIEKSNFCLKTWYGAASQNFAIIVRQ